MDFSLDLRYLLVNILLRPVSRHVRVPLERIRAQLLLLLRLHTIQANFRRICAVQPTRARFEVRVRIILKGMLVSRARYG